MISKSRSKWSRNLHQSWMIFHNCSTYCQCPVSGLVPALPSYRQGTVERHEWPSAMSRGRASETLEGFSISQQMLIHELSWKKNLKVFLSCHHCHQKKRNHFERKWRNSLIHTSWRRPNNPAFLQVASLLFFSATPLPCPLGLPSERPQFLMWLDNILHSTWITKKMLSKNQKCFSHFFLHSLFVCPPQWHLPPWQPLPGKVPLWQRHVPRGPAPRSFFRSAGGSLRRPGWCTPQFRPALEHPRNPPLSTVKLRAGGDLKFKIAKFQSTSCYLWTCTEKGPCYTTWD